MSYTIRQLKHFITVAELGSFKATADKLYVAQPALSVSIRKLESTVGAKLLERGSRGVTLTLAGSAFLRHVKLALQRLQDAELAVTMANAGKLGTIRLGFIASASYTILPRCLPKFNENYPNINIQLWENTSLDLVERLNKYEVDAAIISGSLKLEEEILSWEIMRDDLVLALPTKHEFSHVKQLSLKTCAHEDFIMYSPTDVPALYNKAIAVCLEAGFTPKVCQEANQVQTLISLVASGMGIALVPANCRTHSVQNVSFVDIQDSSAKSTISYLLATNQLSELKLITRLKDVILSTIPNK